ncbi:MAG: nitrate reductase subunit beta, partial [Pseudonocardia sp.]
AMYRLLAIAKYEDRYVIPTASAEDAHKLDAIATGCSLDTDGGPGMSEQDFHIRGDAGGDAGNAGDAGDAGDAFTHTDTPAAPLKKLQRVNLLNWDGNGTPTGLFPERTAAGTEKDA